MLFVDRYLVPIGFESGFYVHVSIYENKNNLKQPVAIRWRDEPESRWISLMVFPIIDQVDATLVLEALFDLSNRDSMLLSKLDENA